MSFDGTGELMAAKSLPRTTLALFGLQHPLGVDHLTVQHQRYLAFHRAEVFRRGEESDLVKKAQIAGRMNAS